MGEREELLAQNMDRIASLMAHRIGELPFIYQDVKDLHDVADILRSQEGSIAPAQSAPGCICQDEHRKGYCTEPGCSIAVRAPEAADAGAVAWFTHVENADGVVWRLAKTGENTAKYQAVCRDCSAEDALAIVKAHNASPTEAGMRERAALDKVREIASLYFAPWGAAKGARWEDLTGDQPFNPEIAMSLIEDALAPTSTDGKSTTNGGVK